MGVHLTGLTVYSVRLKAATHTHGLQSRFFMDLLQPRDLETARPARMQTLRFVTVNRPRHYSVFTGGRDMLFRLKNRSPNQVSIHEMLAVYFGKVAVKFFKSFGTK